LAIVQVVTIATALGKLGEKELDNPRWQLYR
jgi:hypothetical protein